MPGASPLAPKFSSSMKDEGRVIARIMALADRLSPAACQFLSRAFRDRFGNPDPTAADRMRRLRQKQRNSDAPSGVTAWRNNGEPVTPVPPLHPPAISYASGFSEFWKHYPKHVGKGAAYKAWNRAKLELLSKVVVQAVREQLPYLNREGGKFTPLPATWLNQRRWEDSPELPKSQAQRLWDEAQAEKTQQGELG